MQGIAVLRTPAPDSDADFVRCPACTTPVEEPHSSDYLGLGRIEHSWQCPSCGEGFRTSARMAGTMDAEPEAITGVAA